MKRNYESIVIVDALKICLNRTRIGNLRLRFHFIYSLIKKGKKCLLNLFDLYNSS